MDEELHSLINRGADLLGLGNTEEAERYFSQVLEVEPSYPLALYNSAIALSRLDRFKLAEERLLTFLGLRPDDGDAWNQLGYIRFLSGNYGEAARAYQRADELIPDDATLQNNIGALHFIQGRIEEAEKRFRRALEINPKHPDALYNLADTCDELGKSEEALKLRRKMRS